MRSIDEYTKLNYRFSLRKDDDGDFIAEVDELPGCIADGHTPDEAIENLREAMKSWMASRKEAGLEIPEPKGTAEYSGKILVRMPKSLHRNLAEQAAREGVSLNQHIVSALSESSGRLQATQWQGVAGVNSVYACASQLFADAAAYNSRVGIVRSGVGYSTVGVWGNPFMTDWNLLNCVHHGSGQSMLEQNPQDAPRAATREQAAA